VIEASGIEVRATSAAELAQAVPALLGLHQEQWRGRTINSEHLRPRFARHLVRALTTMVARGQAELVQYRMGGRLVIADIDLVGHEFMGTYLAGCEPDLRQRVDIAVLMMSSVLALAERRGLPAVNLLRGDESYKLHWHPVPVRNQRLILAPRGRRRPAAAAYGTLVLARTAAADAVRSRAPWLRSARNRLRWSAGYAARRE